MVSSLLFAVIFTFQTIANYLSNFLWPTHPPIVDFQKSLFSEVACRMSTARNGIDTLICWIFLVIVVRSPRFVGCSTIRKNLICLPRFWTLVFLLVLYILNKAFAIWLFISTSALPHKDTGKSVFSDGAIAVCVMMAVIEILNGLTKVALVGVLNHVQVRNVARSGLKYWLLKGTLIVTWIFQFCTLISAVEIAALLLVGQSSVNDLLLVPFLTKTTELIWTKILQDNNYIIGNNERNESNSFTRQNPRISNAIETI